MSRLLKLTMPAPAAVSYRIIKSDQLTEKDLTSIANLFSACYGVWGPTAPAKLVGKRVRLSSSAVKSNYLTDPGSFAVLAVDPESGKLAGHALCKIFFSTQLNGTVLWITQLVVSTEFRNRHIAGALISNATFSSHPIAVGLVTSHPFAVKALETAAGKKVFPDLVSKYAQNFFDCAAISYLPPSTSIRGCVANTNYHVDHQEILQLIRGLGHEWKLGTVNDGEEFIAVVFLKGDGNSTSSEMGSPVGKNLPNGRFVVGMVLMVGVTCFVLGRFLRFK